LVTVVVSFLPVIQNGTFLFTAGEIVPGFPVSTAYLPGAHDHDLLATA